MIVFGFKFYIINRLKTRSGVEDTRFEAKDKNTKKTCGQGQAQPFWRQTLSRPRTEMLDAKHQTHRRKEENKKRSSKFSARFLAFSNKISTIQKKCCSRAEDKAIFKDLRLSRPRPKTSKCVLETKDVLKDSTSAKNIIKAGLTLIPQILSLV